MIHSVCCISNGVLWLLVISVFDEDDRDITTQSNFKHRKQLLPSEETVLIHNIRFNVSLWDAPPRICLRSINLITAILIGW